MPSIWSYSDSSDRGYGLFKRRLFRELEIRGWRAHLAEASLIDPAAKPQLRDHWFDHPSDWILLINQTAAHFYEYLEIPPDQRPVSVKKIVWFLDDPRFFVTQAFEAEEYVFCFDETYLDFLRENNPRFCGFMPLAADVAEAGVYDPAFASEVCFVGGMIDQSERRRQLSPEMTEYVDRLVEEKLRQRFKTFDQLAEEIPFAPGKRIHITPQVAHYLYWEANIRYRIRTLEALADFDLRIYGNEDWERLLSGSLLLRRFHGPADPVRDLPRIFVSAKINLNIHSIQCRGSLNQRDFNAPLAGGFLLSDWVPAAGSYFSPGVEAVYWSDINDLRQKIVYYLAHERERAAIVKRGQQRAQRDHTYHRRIQQLLSVLDACASRDKTI